MISNYYNCWKEHGAVDAEVIRTRSKIWLSFSNTGLALDELLAGRPVSSKNSRTREKAVILLGTR